MECDFIMKDNDKNKKSSGKQTYYMPIFMCLGTSLGIAIGIATSNMPICMCLGVSFGLCVGSLIDANNLKKSKENAKEDHEETE